MFQINKFYNTVITTLIFPLIFCSPKHSIINSPIISNAALVINKQYASEIQGYCRIIKKGKTLKTRVVATIDSGTVNALLMDELGIPLTVIRSNDTSCEVLRYFPPLNRKFAKLFGKGITSIMKSFALESPKKIIKFDQQKDFKTYYFFSNEHDILDSTILYQRNGYLSTILNFKNSFYMLNNRRDTVCNCVWDL